MAKPPAQEAKQAAPAGPTNGYYLELYFPLTRTILPQHYVSESDAVVGSYAHFVAFPKGYAQIRQIETNEIVLNHQQLFQRFRERRR